MIPAVTIERDVVILTCAISAGIHAALVREHFGESAGAGGGFLASVVLLGAAVVLLTRGPLTTPLLAGVSVVLVGLLVSYLLAVTVGVPLLHPEVERVDGLALGTKAIELIGLLAALELIRNNRPTTTSTLVQSKGTPA